MLNRFFTGNRTAPDASPTRRLPTEIETASLPDVAVGGASSDWICLETHRFHGDNAPASLAEIEDESHGFHEDDAPARDSLPDDVEEGGDSSGWIYLLEGAPHIDGDLCKRHPCRDDMGSNQEKTTDGSIRACGSACGSGTVRRCDFKRTLHQAGGCSQ
jgi:hypothetical protein